MLSLLPIPADRRATRSVVLLGGLAAYGASVALMLRAGLGVMPWTVLDQGLAATFGGQVGTWSIATGAVVLLLWLPLRARPGIGTLANVVMVGASIDATLAVLPAVEHSGARWVLLLAGVALNGVATGAYVGAGLGSGPRDGVGLALAERTKLPLRLVRAAVELAVLAVGWALGGTVGLGTLIYALAIGRIVHVTVPMLRLRTASAGSPAGVSA